MFKCSRNYSLSLFQWHNYLRSIRNKRHVYDWGLLECFCTSHPTAKYVLCHLNIRLIVFPSKLREKKQKHSTDVLVYILITRLTVRFLVSGTSAWTSELFGLAASGIGDQQSSVVADQHILNLLLGGLVHIWKPRGKNNGIENSTLVIEVILACGLQQVEPTRH